MGLLLRWNDHIRPVDEGTFSASSTIHIKTIIPAGKEMLFHFTVVLLAAELDNDPFFAGRTTSSYLVQ